MATLEELKKRAKQEYEEEQNRKKEQTTSQPTNSGTSSLDALKKRAKQEYDAERAKAVDSSYINSFLDSTNKFFSSVEEETGKVGWGNASTAYQNRANTWNDLDQRRGNIRSWLDLNKDKYAPEDYEEFASYLDALGTDATSVLDWFKGTKDFYSQWETEDQYNFWNSHNTAEKRQQTYADNESRIKELEDLYDEAANIDSWYSGYQMNPGAWDEATVNENLALYNRVKDEFGSVYGIQEEIERLKADNISYKRGGLRNQYGQEYGNKTLDDYTTKYLSDPAFRKSATKRDLGNSSVDDFVRYNELNDSSNWIYEADGTIRAKDGTVIVDDGRGNLIHPGTVGMNTVNDRLGLYLEASEEERLLPATTISGMLSNVMTEGATKHWELLSAEELSIYYGLLNTEGKQAAQNFLDQMQVTLDMRFANKDIESISQMYDASDLLGKIMLNAATTPANLVSGVAGGIEDAIALARGEDINPYSSAHAGMHYAQTVRGKTAQEIDKNANPNAFFTWGDAYQAGMSIADSLAAIGIGGSAGGALLAMGAAENEAYRLYQQGASNDQIAMGAALAGAAEMVFETISIDKLINMKDATTLLQVVKNALIQGGIEASEEVFTEIANTVTNAIIMGTQSDWDKLLTEKGNYGDALRQKTLEVLQAGLAGAVSGGISGFGGSLISYGANKIQQNNNYASAGSSIMDIRGGVDSLKSLAMEVSGAKGSLARQAKSVNADSTSRGNRVKVGKLYQKTSEAVSKMNRTDIEASLVEKGFSKKEAKRIGEYLHKASTGGYFTWKEQNEVENDQRIIEVLRDVVANQESTINQRTKKFIEAFLPKSATASTSGKGVVTETSYEVSKGGTTRLIEDDSEIRIAGVADVKGGKMTLKLEDGRTVDSSEVAYSSDDEALIYEAVANMDVSADTAWSLIKGFKAEDGVSAKTYAIDLPLAYKYGRLNYKAGLENLDLTVEQRMTAFFRGRADAEAEVGTDVPQADVSKASITDKATGKKIIFEGFTYDEKTAKPMQRASIAAIDMISKMSNLEVHVYQSFKENGKIYARVNGKLRPAPNGYFTEGNKIYIDINAGNNMEGSMLYTMSHEVGHYIAQWNKKDFKAISDFLFEHYGKDVPILDMLEKQKEKVINSYKTDGKALPGEAELDALAHEELVCDMLSRMFADKNAYDVLMELKQENLNLFQKLGRAIKKLLDNLKELIGVYDGQNPDFQYAASVENFGEEAFRQLQELYMRAFVQADANYQAAENSAEDVENGGETVYSNRRYQKVFFKENVFPPFDESHSEAHELAERWAKSEDTETGDRKLISYHKQWYLIEAFEDLKYGYQIMKKLTKKEYIKEALYYGTITGYESIQNTSGENAALLRTVHHSAGRGYSSDPDAPQHRGADNSLHGVGATQNSGGNTRSNGTGNLSSSGQNTQGENGFAVEGGTISTASVDVEVDEKTESVAPAVLLSERTWTESDYVQEREKAAKEIAKAIGVSVKKAKAYIDSVNSIAKMIAEDRVRLDYFSSPGRSSFVGNVEYGGSFDFSTLCKKRRLLTGTFTAIQKALPNTALTANEILDIRNRMKEKGLEVSCGLCYVEGSRANMGQFAKEFLRLYKQYYPDAWQPNMADVNTPDGIEWVRINHPECYEQYEYFWNHYGTLKPGDKNLFASQQKPKLYQLHTEYQGEIFAKFGDDDNVAEKNMNGGIRLQSFSDFEIVHLIDTMQIIMDMSRVGLAGQAYTKVPDFAWALGDTGLKINLSLIAKGVDENGRLIFDDVEGMPIETAMALRNRYSKNVGTILVAFNDEQLLAAMADERVDFIIPFHRSQWKKSQYEAMGLPAKTKDYTYMQNEKYIKPQYHEYRGRMVRDKATNYMPNEYWDFSKSGKENAVAYLEMCARNNKRPKFYKLLQNNGDGSYSLKADGSTDGYWKLLIDFKMYDNDGVGSPQMPVKPEFNMVEATRMLNEYSGGHSNFPVAQGIVDSFVQEYKDSHEGVQYSERDSEYMAAVNRGDMEAAQRMVDMAAKNAGYTTRGYHGSWNDFSVVDGWLWLARDKSVAKGYGTFYDVHDSKKPYDEYGVYSMRYNLGNNLNVYADGASWGELPVTEDEYPGVYVDEETGAITTNAMAEWAELNGYDSITFENVDDGGYTTVDVVFNPNRDAKSADPVTYDDSGKVIPLSERFKEENDDIRYSDRDLPSVDNYGGKLPTRRELWYDIGTISSRIFSVEMDLREAEKAGYVDHINRVRSRLADVKERYIEFGEYLLKNYDNYSLSDIRSLGVVLRLVESFSKGAETYTIEQFREDLSTRIKGYRKDVAAVMREEVKAMPHEDRKLFKAMELIAAMTGYDASTVDNAVDSAEVFPEDEWHTDGEPFFQERTDESVSNRSLLVDAFEEMVRSPQERKMIDEYRANISKVEDVQERLGKIRVKIHELTVSKGDKAKIAALKKTAAELADLIDKYDRKLLEMEASKPLRDVLARARQEAYRKAKQKGEERMAEYRQKVSERFDRGVESRKKTAMMQKIRKVIRDLDKILNRGDKKRNVKEGMKGFVEEALASAEILFIDNYGNEDMIRNGVEVEMTPEEEKYMTEARAILAKMDNLPSGSYEAWAERQGVEESLKSQLAYRMGKLKDVFYRERLRLNKTKVADVLSKLADAYAKLETSEYAYVNGAYNEAVHQYLKTLQDEVGGATIRDMSLSQLELMHTAYKMVLRSVQKANEMFTEGWTKRIDELANGIMFEVEKAGGVHGIWSPMEVKQNRASWNNTKPIYAAERIGSETFKQLWAGLFKGQYNWALDMEEAKLFRQKVAEKYGAKEWDMEKMYTFTSASGLEFQLNLNQIMSIYAYSKREQAHDHLTKGGFVFGRDTEVIVNEHGIKKTYFDRSASAYKVSDELIEEIVGVLDKVPGAKKFVDEMQDYLSTTMGEKGNEVSLKLYGVKIFNEAFYFPLRSAGQYMERAKEADLKKQQGQVSIANSSFTHATKPKANNPVVLEGFMDVWASHVNEMSLYHSMVLPMEDFRRVYNYSSPNMEGQDSVSVNGVIENAYGPEATGYIDQLYKELNGGAVTDPRETAFKERIGKFKKAAVMLSSSVVVQQFSAIGRAYALIDPKYFIGAKVDKKRHKLLWEEMKQYAPVAIIKEMGGFDTGMGGSAKDFLLAEEYGKGERIKGFMKDEQYRSEVMGLAPAKADELTWCAIWEAVKRETKANNPNMDVTSEEFLKKAGERFSEVIEKTQVYDSVLARSANMRSKNGLMQMATAFLAEPTTTVNMIEDALRKKDKKYIARTFGAVFTSIVINNALASIVYAMRDDDDDETFLEKYTQAFTSGMLDDINPLTYYPFLKDVWSLLQGYDVERSDMSVVSDVTDAVKKLATTFAKRDADMSEEELAEWLKEIGGGLMGMLDAGLNALGVPFKNVRREIEAIANTFKTFSKTFGSTTWNSFVDALGSSVLDSTPIVGIFAGESRTDKIYDAIISGDSTYLKRLKAGYKSEDAYNTAVRKALRENDPRIHQAALAGFNGDPSERVRIARLIIADGFSQDNVVAAINAEINKMEPDKEKSAPKAKGFYTAEDFAREIANGDQASANAVKVDIIQTAQKNGKSAEDAKKSFVSSAKTELKDLFLSGKISEQKAINALTTYCDIEESDAIADVQYWAFKQEFPEVFADDQWFDTYYEKVADSGIEIDVYMEYRNAVAGITGENKKAGRMSVINSLPITSAQKDALYLAEGWAASKLYEAPWH